MRAVVVHGAKDLRIDEVPTPTPAAGEVRLEIEWGGICGSDLSYVAKAMSGTAVLSEPLTLGHEIAGRVVEVGDGVDDALVGQRATVFPPTFVDGHELPDRLAGRHNLHPRVRYLGSAALTPHTHGGFSEQVVIRADQLRVLPENLDTRIGALAEPWPSLSTHCTGLSRCWQVASGAGPSWSTEPGRSDSWSWQGPCTSARST